MPIMSNDPELLSAKWRIWDQAWEQSRHLEVLRGQYLGFFFTAVLVARKVKGAILYGIIFTMALAWPLGRWWGTDTWHVTAGIPLVKPSHWWAAPDFSLVLSLDLVQELRPTESSAYTERETPIFTCVAMSARKALDALDGSAAVAAEPSALA